MKRFLLHLTSVTIFALIFTACGGAQPEAEPGQPDAIEAPQATTPTVAPEPTPTAVKEFGPPVPTKASCEEPGFVPSSLKGITFSDANGNPLLTVEFRDGPGAGTYDLIVVTNHNTGLEQVITAPAQPYTITAEISIDIDGIKQMAYVPVYVCEDQLWYPFLNPFGIQAS